MLQELVGRGQEEVEGKRKGEVERANQNLDLFRSRWEKQIPNVNEVVNKMKKVKVKKEEKVSEVD